MMIGIRISHGLVNSVSVHWSKRLHGLMWKEIDVQAHRLGLGVVDYGYCLGLS